uniref:Replication-associated protein n=1 Tax=Zosterops erythropleurus Genomoviridae sp. TaxID=2814957 RepID=A0A8E7G2H2_9VIRU
MPVTSLSLTPSAGTLIHGPLTTISLIWERSASLEERITLMRVLISMLSSISAASSDPETPANLMCTAAIRTFHHQKASRKVVMTTRSRMETLSQEGSHGQASMELCRMAISGAKSSELRVSNYFGNVLNDWIQRHFAPITETSENSPIGDIDLYRRSTSIPPGSILSLEWYLSWLHGEDSVLTMIPQPRLLHGADVR